MQMSHGQKRRSQMFSLLINAYMFLHSSRFDYSGFNFYLVAVHEIGHALGLDHNHDRKSIMYPSYSLFPRSSMLPDYDRRSIQAMYGASEGGGSK